MEGSRPASEVRKMYFDIFPNKVKLWRDKGARIIDVCEPFEFAQGRVTGAEDVPLAKSPVRANELNGPLVLVCASGDRSSAAINALLAAGYTNVSNLTDGFKTWQEHNLPTEKGRAA